MYDVRGLPANHHRPTGPSYASRRNKRCQRRRTFCVFSPPKKTQVAARLGASVTLTDQSKLLPTLTRNARANARDLECLPEPAANATDGAGRWQVAELLFSDSEEDIVRWRRGVPGRRVDTDPADGEPGDDDRGEDLFDLVVAADVVYLNDLWDAMAFTLKVCACEIDGASSESGDDAEYLRSCSGFFFAPSPDPRPRTKARHPSIVMTSLFRGSTDSALPPAAQNVGVVETKRGGPDDLRAATGQR